MTDEPKTPQETPTAESACSGGLGGWMVVNVGCIECGVSTNIVGVFDSEEKANEIAEKCDAKYSWREGGQNRFEVFKVPKAGVIDPEYELDA